MLERVNFVLPMKAIGQAAIMLERVQPRIIQPHGTILKRGEVIGLLETARTDSRCNISFIGDRWVECLAVTETARSWTTRTLGEVTSPRKSLQLQQKGSGIQMLKQEVTGQQQYRKVKGKKRSGWRSGRSPNQEVLGHETWKINRWELPMVFSIAFSLTINWPLRCTLKNFSSQAAAHYPQWPVTHLTKINWVSTSSEFRTFVHVIAPRDR